MNDEQHQRQDIVEARPIDNVPASDIEIAEAHVAALERSERLAERRRNAIAGILVATTYPSDWTRFGKNGEFAGLSAAGADRMIRAIGGISEVDDSWRMQRTEGQNKHGKWFRWTYSVAIRYGDEVCRGEGTAWSQEPFFGRAHGSYRDPDDVVETNVMHAARHRARGEAIKQLFGLRKFPAKVLSDKGFDVKTIEFAEGGKSGGGGSNGDDRKSNRPQNDSEKQELRDLQMEIGRLVLEMNDGDKSAASKHLDDIAGFNTQDGARKSVQSVKDITSVKWAKSVRSKVKKAHDGWAGKAGF